MLRASTESVDNGVVGLVQSVWLDTGGLIHRSLLGWIH
jgi:hypothetical protein